MSHKFHGKGPGKKKTEKRLKREKEEVVRENFGSDIFYFIFQVT